jgi:hypothetical protein
MLESRLRFAQQKSTRLRLKSGFCAEGSGVFHVVACKQDVFTFTIRAFGRAGFFNGIGQKRSLKAHQRMCNELPIAGSFRAGWYGISDRKTLLRHP